MVDCAGPDDWQDVLVASGHQNYAVGYSRRARGGHRGRGDQSAEWDEAKPRRGRGYFTIEIEQAMPCRASDEEAIGRPPAGRAAEWT